MAEQDRRIVMCWHPADPAGVIPGGIDSFIRGIAEWSPTELDYRIIGVTTDVVAHPIGKWSQLSLNGRLIRFFPVLYLDLSRRQRTQIPLSLLFVLAAVRHRAAITAGAPAAVHEVHRFETLLALPAKSGPALISAFCHQDPAAYASRDSDIRWRYAPAIYRAFERWALLRIDALWCVSQAGVSHFSPRGGRTRPRVRLVSTWADPNVFATYSAEAVNELRTRYRARWRVGDVAFVMVFVGRFDHQKNPLMLLSSFSLLVAREPAVRLVMVGDGVLRPQVEQAVVRLGLSQHVIIEGRQPREEVAAILNACDAFVLPSVYEGMPIAALEALATGLPVVATDVGEVRRMVVPGENGELAGQTPDAFAQAMEACVRNCAKYRGEPCRARARLFHPQTALANVFRFYRTGDFNSD